MTEQPFNDVVEFLKLFSLGEGSPYSQPTILTDRKVGFSVQRKYPTDIRYAPPKTKEGEDDTVALIHVVYRHQSEVKGRFDPQKVPIIVRIGLHSLYRADRFDYNFDDKDCPTEESLRISKSTPQPISLDFIGDFFYDHGQGKFLNQANNVFTGNQLLDHVFAEHCNTVHLVKGLKYRFQLKTRTLSISILSILINLFPLVLRKGFGRTLDESKNSTPFLKGYKKTDLKTLSTESLNIFGYKASKSVIIIFCILVFLAYICWNLFGMKHNYVRNIFSSSFLSITHSILLLYFLDDIFPAILFGIMNCLIKWRASIMLKGMPRF